MDILAVLPCGLKAAFSQGKISHNALIEKSSSPNYEELHPERVSAV